MARAWASIFAAVGSLRMKLQLLQPMAGVRPTPLASARAVVFTPAAALARSAVAAGAPVLALAAVVALAGGAAEVAAKTASGTAASPATRPRMYRFMRPP